MDNYTTHRPAALYEVFKPEEAKRILDRFEFIYTLKHGSWLNMAEIELSYKGDIKLMKIKSIQYNSPLLMR